MHKHLDKTYLELKEGRTEKGDKFFWEFWERNKGILYRVCLKMMDGSLEDARDALSTAMLSAWEKFPKHASRLYNLGGWLMRLTRNVCIDILRKNKKEKNKLCNESISIESTEDAMYRDEILNEVYQSINQLPGRLREPVLLRFFLKMRYKDIARHCGLSNVNVRKRIQQARVILFNQFRNTHEQFDFFLQLNKNTRTTHHSPTWVEAIREAKMIVNRKFQEINGSFTATRFILLKLPSGIENSVQIFFNSSLHRQMGKTKTLQNYVNRYQTGWKKRMKLAESLYIIGNWNQAINECYLVLQKHPQSMAIRIKLGEMLNSIEKEDEAARVLEKGLLFARKNATKYHLRGMIYLYKRRIDLALKAFRKAISLEKTNVAHQQQMAISYVLAGRPIEAQQTFEKILNIKPHNFYSLTQIYDCLISTGCLKKAEQYVNRVLEIYPDDILALKRKVEQRCQQAMVWKDEGKYTRKLIRKMQKNAPYAAEVHESKSIYCFYRGEFRKGLNLLKQFTKERPNCLYGWYYYGRWLYRLGSYSLAGEVILKTFAMYKKNPLLNCSVCEILASARMKKELKIALQDILKRFPGHWNICSSAGLALTSVFSEIQWARELCSRALELQPSLPEAYFRFGRMLSNTGDHEKAIETLLTGWQLLPEDEVGCQSIPTAWLMAQNYKILKDNAQTQAWLDEVINRTTQFKIFMPAEAYYWQGKALYEQGDSEGAVQALRNALSFQLFYPARRDARSILKCCSWKLKNSKKS